LAEDSTSDHEMFLSTAAGQICLAGGSRWLPWCTTVHAAGRRGPLQHCLSTYQQGLAG
jgi:hypothetical protein